MFRDCCYPAVVPGRWKEAAVGSVEVDDDEMLNGRGAFQTPVHPRLKILIPTAGTAPDLPIQAVVRGRGGRQNLYKRRGRLQSTACARQAYTDLEALYKRNLVGIGANA